MAVASVRERARDVEERLRGRPGLDKGESEGVRED